MDTKGISWPRQCLYMWLTAGMAAAGVEWIMTMDLTKRKSRLHNGITVTDRLRKSGLMKMV